MSELTAKFDNGKMILRKTEEQLKHKILLVDDEGAILNSLKRLLRKEQVEVFATTSPEEALGLLKKHQFSLIISDHRMPVMLGTQLLKIARKISPDTIRIMLTGYADSESAVEAINQGAVTRFLAKPWNDIELRVAVRQALAQYKLVQDKEALERLTNDQYKELQTLAIELEEKVEERTKEVSELNKRLKYSFMESVRVMSEITEMHSGVIGTHAKRLASLCLKVGKRVGMDDDQLFQLEAAALLHNIGKLGMSSEVLEKPKDQLTVEEKTLMYYHPVRGEAVVKLVPDLLEAATYVRHLHELFNGQGYPDHLKGDNIPLGARIISIVDGYDTCLNARDSYNSTTPLDAMNYVQDHTPSYYDPELVPVLKECLLESLSDEDGIDEIEIQVNDARSGMVLSRDTFTNDGKLLLPKDSELNHEELKRVRNYYNHSSITDTIFVYRHK